MSDNNPIPVTVRILDREYQVACPEEEKQPLMESARYLDSKMKDIKGDRKVVGTDRIAVMAALNIAHEYLQSQTSGGSRNDGPSNGGKQSKAISSEQLNSLHEKLEMALNRYKQTELAI